MKRASLLAALLVCALYVVGFIFGQQLPRQDTWIPASKVRVTGLTSTNLQDAITNGESASFPHGPSFATSLRNYRIWFEDFNDCASVINNANCTTTPGNVQQTTGGLVATQIGTLTTGALSWRGSNGDRLRIYPDATANEGYWVQMGATDATTGAAAYTVTPLAGVTHYIEIGLSMPNLTNRDIFIGVAEGGVQLLQADGTFTGSTSKQHAGFHLLLSGSETHFRTTYCAVNIANTVRGSVAISANPPASSNLLTDRYGIKIVGLDRIEFYYAEPGETTMELIETVDPMPNPFQGSGYGMTPSFGIVGNGNPAQDLEIDYILVVSDRKAVAN